MDIKELAALLRQNGVVGAGGAGFPTYAKLDARADTIVMNCAECEPLLKLHRQLLESHAEEIVAAFKLIKDTVGAQDAIIGIKKAYKQTIAALEEVLPRYEGVRLGLLDEVYPAGDEVVLIYEVTGRVVRPGGLPIECGVCVFNVETCYNLSRALHKQEPVVDKLVSVVAEVNHPVTLRMPIGATVEDAVRLAGGAKIKDPVYFVGGPMMGNILPGTTPITKTTNAILVLPQNHYLIERKRSRTETMLKRAAASCCQCSMCTDLCPRHMLGHPIQPHLFMRAATCKDVQDPNIFVNTFFCCSCGLCELYSCFQGLSPRSLMAEYKNGLRAAGVKPPKVEAAPVNPARELRKAPMKRLMARLDLVKYDAPAPLQDECVAVKTVHIPTRQHIGAPAVPCVKAGDVVERGQVVANPAEGLSVAIHASVKGRVREVTAAQIVIDTIGE